MAIVHHMQQHWSPYDPVFYIRHLPLPKTVQEDIQQEFDLQIELYFTLIIEPTIEYKLPNEY